LTWSFYDGSINYNGALPVADANGTYSVPIISYYHSFDFFGRSANVVASLPYAVGNFEGTVSGAGQHLYRSGLLDSVFRVSVNLKGGPAMPVQNYMKWKQKVLLGASLKVIAPTGQYDPTKLINWGATGGPSNRSLAIRNAGTNGCSMGTWECGSSPRIPISGRATSTASACQRLQYKLTCISAGRQGGPPLSIHYRVPVRLSVQ